MKDRADVLKPSREFAQILADNPSELNSEELKRASQWLLVFEDETFGSQFPSLKKLKINVLKMAIEDISGRAQILTGNTLGVTCQDKELQTFLTPFGTLTLGTIVYKLGIKGIESFRKWRLGEASDITQADINSILYKLVYEWSKLLK